MSFADGYKAVIAYDPEIELFRGKFVGLNGGADFYACDLAGLRKEGENFLWIFLDECERRGIATCKEKTWNFALRLAPLTYEKASVAAQSKNISLNSFIAEAVRQYVANV